MMKIKKKKSAETNERRRYPAAAVSLCLVFSLICLTFLSGCAAEDGRENLSAQSPAAPSEVTGGLKITGSMEISYASEFSVDYLDNGGRLIRISDGSVFLVLPEGASVPGGLSEEITVLRQPVSRIYLAAAAAMDHFCKIGATDAVALTGKKASDWYIEEARNAVEEGRILYAGKYNMPDYELILQQKCTLAVESTMIFHTPEVKEKLEENGIPVLVDYSSYEEHPLGRSEWIKLYGVLTGHEQEAEAAFREQTEKMEAAVAAAEGDSDKEGKKTAFFYITASGGVNVRKPGDYVSKMIEMAGGEYIFEGKDAGDGKASTTETIQMEDFYAAARDADYLIYNSTVDGELDTVEELLKKSELLGDFKAVKEGHVYCTGKNMYQETSESGTMVYDLYQMYSGREDGMEFLYKLK